MPLRNMQQLTRRATVVMGVAVAAASLLYSSSPKQPRLTAQKGRLETIINGRPPLLVIDGDTLLLATEDASIPMTLQLSGAQEQYVLSQLKPHDSVYYVSRRDNNGKKYVLEIAKQQGNGFYDVSRPLPMRIMHDTK